MNHGRTFGRPPRPQNDGELWMVDEHHKKSPAIGGVSLLAPSHHQNKTTKEFGWAVMYKVGGATGLFSYTVGCARVVCVCVYQRKGLWARSSWLVHLCFYCACV